MALERTLSIIKPDAVAANHIGDIVNRFEKAGLTIAGMKMLRMNRPQAEGFYAVHRERPFFGSLVEFMTSGPVVVMILEGEDAISKNREIMGPTNSNDAPSGTIRGDFGTDVEKNAVHGSDATETAATEISYFFTPYELNA
ncbi:MAG: nucleoside-diphosphate kinase [Desulfatibacillaceae bacterium]